MKFSTPLLVAVVTLLSFTASAQKPAYAPDSLARLDSVRTYMLQGSLLSMNAMQAKIESQQPDANGKMVVNQQKAGEAQNLFQQARFAYRKALQFDDKYATGWSNLGTTYYFEGLPRVAIPYFMKSVKLNNNYSQGWFNLGKSYSLAGKKDSAVYAFRQAIRCDSAYVQPYIELSTIYMLDKDSAAALGQLRTAVKYRPASEVTWMAMANVYLQNQDSAAAVTALEAAARINPDNYARLEDLARYFLFHNDKAKHDYYMKLAAEARKREEMPERGDEE